MNHFVLGCLLFAFACLGWYAMTLFLYEGPVFQIYWLR